MKIAYVHEHHNRLCAVMEQAAQATATCKHLLSEAFLDRFGLGCAGEAFSIRKTDGNWDVAA